MFFHTSSFLMDHLVFLVVLSSDSKPLFFHTYAVLVSYLMFPLVIGTQPACPIPRTLAAVGNSCSWRSQKGCGGHLVPSSLPPRTATSRNTGTAPGVG